MELEPYTYRIDLHIGVSGGLHGGKLDTNTVPDVTASHAKFACSGYKRRYRANSITAFGLTNTLVVSFLFMH